MTNNIAIKVDNLSKTFTIPHEKISTLRGAFVNLFRPKTYERFKALDDVSFEVKKGEFFGIIGRNGSGKSTLLKILAGIYKPNAGRIRINGLVSPFLELGIGFNPELSGRDNIYLNATVLGLSEKEINKKFDDIVNFSELRRFIDQKVKNYSSGMQVRLAFSVAIHANRDILLMDEVLAVGDANFQGKCLEEFNRYRDLGKTVILVTHDIGTIQRYCDRAMLLRDGKIVTIGDPQEVGNRYALQNMSDEERRITEEEKRLAAAAEKEMKRLKGKLLVEERKRIEEEKRKREEERRNRVAEITKVEFSDRDGQRKNVFEKGESLTVKVYFKIYKQQDILNFGIAIYNQENDYVFGINTIMDEINTEKYVKNGFVEMDFKNIPLNSNSYYILAGIGGRSFSPPFALLPKSQYFKVVSKKVHEGIFELNYSWR